MSCLAIPPDRRVVRPAVADMALRAQVSEERQQLTLSQMVLRWGTAPNGRRAESQFGGDGGGLRREEPEVDDPVAGPSRCT